MSVQPGGPRLFAQFAYPPNELGYCGPGDALALLEHTSTGVDEPAPDGALPHHSFHVFGVYPWVGLLRLGRVDEPLTVLDRCRIRWGRVLATGGEWATVDSRPLHWDGHRLALGPPRAERVRWTSSGVGLARDLAVGDVCAMHWDWVCDVLTPARLAALRRYSAGQMALVNAARYPAPATVLA